MFKRTSCRVTGAEQGKLVIFCGGRAADVARLEPIFKILAQRHTRIGGVGAGQTLKLCNQLIVSTNLVAIAESLALARASGLDLKMLPDTLAGGFADSLPLQLFGRRMATGVTASSFVSHRRSIELRSQPQVSTRARARVDHPRARRALAAMQFVRR